MKPILEIMSDNLLNTLATVEKAFNKAVADVKKATEIAKEELTRPLTQDEEKEKEAMDRGEL